MPTYGKNDFKESNVNYLNKDFLEIKNSLMNYAKSYFPNTYRDFNETSPGMMLLEMNAYVGDVLSFYVDKQYQEMLLPLAEERRNILTMAKMFGYKVKPIVPSYTDLTFTSEVNASSGDASKIDYSNGGIFDDGIEIASSANSDVIFTTLEPIDFQISSSADGDTVGTTLASGLASTYTLSRTVRAVSATQKTKKFKIGTPEKFKRVTIPDTNVIDIVSCVDSNGQNWYEVDYLAQDKVPITTHYTDDTSRGSAYQDEAGLQSLNAVPYSLTYITTTKRFTRETNQDNTTTLVFGNGLLKNGELVDEGYIDLEQVGITVAGQYGDLQTSIDPLLGNEYSTLGETPNNTTLTITYRVGGGVSSNVPSGDISTAPTTLPAQNGNTAARISTVTNNNPAVGGKDEEDTVEIKEKAKAFFTTQNRCVTKEDYEARVMNIPAKYGNVAKVYVTRTAEFATENEYDSQVEAIQSAAGAIGLYQTNLESALGASPPDVEFLLTQLINNAQSDGIVTQLQNTVNELPSNLIINDNNFGTIDIYVLAYNSVKQLVGNPHIDTTGGNNNLPSTLTSNISKYLDNFKLLTDVVTINDGYIVNFGVIFDIIAEKYADKQQVKINCIQRIKDYFKIERMQFNQPIYKSQLEFELMGVEGVRSIGHVTITQYKDYNDPNDDMKLTEPTYTYSREGDAYVDQSTTGDGSIGYGYKYNFDFAMSDDGTIIIPPTTDTPAVFELKNPNENIQGRVR